LDDDFDLNADDKLTEDERAELEAAKEAQGRENVLKLVQHHDHYDDDDHDDDDGGSKLLTATITLRSSETYPMSRELRRQRMCCSFASSIR